MKRILILSAIFVVAALASLSGISPQEPTAAVQGTVSDDQGAPLQGVQVTAVNVDSGMEYRALTDAGGNYAIKGLPPGKYEIRVEINGFVRVVKKDLKLKAGETAAVSAKIKRADLQPPIETRELKEAQAAEGRVVGGVQARMTAYAPPPGYADFNTEEYSLIVENVYLDALNNPLSTFSIDVDTASYANVRRFLKMNQLPPQDAVRIEEMINYFDYDYPLPEGDAPFSIFTEISTAPWKRDHRLVHIGLQGKRLEAAELPPSNLVFLIDVSGSMGDPQKLPLLKSAFQLLVNQLSAKDKISIAVYAGAAGLVLPPTGGDHKDRIIDAIEKLQSGGSTAGGEGIQLAYKAAEDSFIKGGNNRVILATDGDFNIGVSSTSELVRMIEEKRKQGIFLTILGFGMGNYKDSRMEQMADKGNGNYYYIDSLLEAKKVFVNDMRGTLFTIAKDVKIQVEFNPAKVKAYRLIGYENRMLKKEDFADDTKDAGELGAGHTVTALYEIIPFGSEEEVPGIDKLKYQETRISPEAFRSKELMTVKLRYKRPDSDTSRLIEQPLVDKGVKFESTTDNFKFAAAVAELGMLLRDSEFKADSSLADVLKLAKESKGPDPFGYRAEFIQLVELSLLLDELKR